MRTSIKYLKACHLLNVKFLIRTQLFVENYSATIFLYIWAGCGDIEADILFLLDASGSVKLHNYRKAKRLLQYTAKQFNIDEGKVRMAAVVFS